jgi:hypothetical protein
MRLHWLLEFTGNLGSVAGPVSGMRQMALAILGLMDL